MTITAEDIKAQQSKIAEMISTFKANKPATSPFPVTANTPELNESEKHLGCIISADGSIREHIILLPGEKSDISWSDAMDWAASIGGELPNRVESALLFATMKDQFQPEWYWTREQGAHNGAYAWMQLFYYGTQYYGDHKSYECRARAVRRLLIIE